MGNVVGKPGRRGNRYPAKQRPGQKVDAAVALMMAVGRAMAENDGQGDLMDSSAIQSSADLGAAGALLRAKMPPRIGWAIPPLQL
jgi:hypothetical protein